jgi:hypothetical protein
MGLRRPATGPRRITVESLPARWAAPLADAQEALGRYRLALHRCPPGPLRSRLEDLEAEFSDSIERCRELARWGADAQAAARELDPGGIERAARPTGAQARYVARDQREVKDRLHAVQGESAARLALINGRLDEAVGRAVEMAGRAAWAGPAGAADLDLGAGELAAELRALRAALDEVEGLGLDGVAGTEPGDRPRGTTRPG